jgi:hypothetical protein
MGSRKYIIANLTQAKIAGLREEFFRNHTSAGSCAREEAIYEEIISVDWFDDTLCVGSYGAGREML